MPRPLRACIAFAVLFALYQAAEGIGTRLAASFALTASLMLACVIVAWPLSRWLGWFGYGAYALGWQPRAAWLWFAGGFALAFGAKFAATWIGLAQGIYAAHAGSILAPITLAAVPMLLVSTFVPSLAEDILTRGFWYRAAGIAWRRGIAFVLFSALLYVLNHIYRLALGPWEWALLASYGVTYAAALWRSGSLWAAVGLHWGWNLANACLDVDAVDPHAGAALSIAAHLAMLVIVLAMPRTRATKLSTPLAERTT